MKLSLLAASLAFGLVLSTPLLVHAYGSEDNVTSTTSDVPKKCKKGKVWNKKKKRCVKKRSSLGPRNISMARFERAADF